MRAPIIRLHNDELIVDSFAGGGGASVGIEMAIGRSPDIAINHDREALSMHAMNHPSSQHLCEDVWAVDPIKATQGRPIGLMWLSPDCKHFSKAKGGKPVEKKIRGLAWVAVRWAKAVKPRVIVLENVEEFADWGPLTEEGMPCKLRKGATFKRFVRQLRNCGYDVDWKMLVAADYGAPTIRKRLFLIARSDGRPIVWPDATHGHGLKPWRTAAECIEWDLPCPSIFERVRPLAENTLRRIARGIRKYVIEAADPFIVPTTHQGDARVYPITEPVRTVTGAKRGEQALVTPILSAFYGVKGQEVSGKKRGRGEHDIAAPLPTVTASSEFSLVAPTLVQTGYDGQKHALVSAFLAKHYGGHETPGSGMPDPFHTITSQDHHAAVASTLVRLQNHGAGESLRKPLGVVMAGGNRGGVHFAEVRAFLTAYYGSERASLGQGVNSPMRTTLSKDRFGLVTVEGEDYAISDIGMRMLQPRELFRAQGFPDTYAIERGADGVAFTKSAQVRMCGNSVCPPVAAAIVSANYGVAVRELVA